MGFLKNLFSGELWKRGAGLKPGAKPRPKTDLEAIMKASMARGIRNVHIPSQAELAEAKKIFEQNAQHFRNDPIYKLVLEKRIRLGLTPKEARDVADNLAVERIAEDEARRRARGK